MKIGMFINYYTPSKGGMETSVINLCKGLEKAGHETFVFAPEYPNWKDKKKNIFRYKSICFNYAGYFYVIPVPFLSNMELTVKRLSLDIIHSHQPYSLGDEALKFSKKFNLPLVFTYHIRYEDYCHYIPFVPRSISKKYIRKITREYSNKCDAVIAPSSAIKKLLLDRGITTPISVIPSGINVEKFGRNTGKREEIRTKYKIKPGDIALITASRIAKEKNVKFLIESFFAVKKKCENVKFFIVGDGAVRKELEKMAKSLGMGQDVIFTGLVSREEIINLYQASDIFVFASLTETQGLVAVEAMAAGLPVVAIRASGIEDMVESGKNGILTKNSTDEFSESVLRLVQNGELRKKMSERAKISSKKFSIEIWTKRMVELYSSLVRRKAAQASDGTAYSNNL